MMLRNLQRTIVKDVVETKPLKRFEVSQKLKDYIGYTLEIKPSQIEHKESGQGLFLDGEADVGAVNFFQLYMLIDSELFFFILF
ncbi:hypothetical protein BUALT_Bualt15G0135300 [Buddleja alternifolia]|uniref:Uncharacterized protein n=1 Tax=Buddleja alternifolia TaxID=168488 RepID=A0AAV6WF96_9LAMI|nr:hypothetical protein BUALT_Bualt15G0135300 [Buddleja alternifolia]